MGRNKKGKSSAAHEMEAEVSSEVGAADDNAGRERGSCSHTSSSREGSVAKKKVYHGNKLNRNNACGKGKKGRQTNPSTAPSPTPTPGSPDTAGGDGDGREVEGAAAPTLKDDVGASRHEPVEVLYCPICTFPAEMCEYSGMYEQCRPWLLEHAKELAEAEERGRKRRALTERERLERLVQGRGTKKAIERIVVIEVSQRKGRKMTTSVRGLDLFGLNLVDFSRDCKKMFSCGAGVKSSEEVKQSSVDIQGNVAAQLIELLPERYNIPKDAMYQIDDKKKVKCYSDA